MFPYVEIFSYKIYFQGLGILIATLVFIYATYRYSKKNNLKFPMFFNYIPLFIILPYLLWRWFYNILEYHLFFPDFTLLSPYGYKFSFIGVSFGFLLSVIIFLLNLKYIQEKKKWFDIFFYSINLAFVILWPFLLLWDVFYWLPTDSVFWVHVFTTNTQIPYLTKTFWPVWIFVSFLGLIMYLRWKILHLIFKKPWLTIFLFPFIWLWFIIIFNFQYYSKHFLFGIDVKILYCIFVSIVGTIFFYWLLNYKRW